MTTVSIIGATFTGNLGGEAMLSTVIRELRAARPDARFVVFSYYPRSDRARGRQEAVTVFSATPARVCLVLFPCSLLFRALRCTGWKWIGKFFPNSVTELARSRVLLDLAGVSFVDGREKFLPYNVLTILTAMILGTPVVKLAQAMGPFKNSLNRFFASRLLRRCKKIFARGPATQSHLQDLGLPGDLVSPATDVTFLHQPGCSPTEENAEHIRDVLGGLERKRRVDQPIIGICPSSLVYQKVRKAGGDYARFLKELAEELIQRGNAVLLFPHATRAAHSPRLRNNDLPVIDAVVRQIEAAGHQENLLHVVGNVNADTIKAMVRLCSVVVVSRFHAVIAALTTRTPVCVLGWGHKYREVMAYFGLERWVYDYSMGNPAEIAGAVESLLAQSESIRSQIAERLPEARASAAGQFEYVKSLLAESNSLETDAP